MTAPWSSVAFAVLEPRPLLSVSEWADQHRVIPAGTSPEPDRWRTSRVPYLREIMDAVSDPSVERVVVQAASQIGKSELLLNIIGYFVDADPSPMMLVQPSEGAALTFSKERIGPMFQATPVLADKLGDALRDPKNAILLKLFPGGLLACAWATSAASLASRPMRVVLFDEVDRYPVSTGRDGDPVAQAEQRTANFFNRKLVYVSTPTIDGLSPIVRLHDDSDQRRLWVPCPRCGAFQVLEWAGIKYKRDDGTIDFDDVHYVCAHCGDRIEESDRPAMLAACEWRPDNPGHRIRGYHLSALCSPWVRWRELAEQWVKVTTDRDRVGMQAFVNLRLGEPWTNEAREEVSADTLERNREDYEAELPDGVLVITAGVDVQDNRLEVEVVGWGLGKESWGVTYHVIVGDTSKAGPWEQLDAFLARTWSRENGTAEPIWCTCIDSGGHRTSDVYAFSRDRLARYVFAVKGYAGQGRPIVGKPSTSNRLRVPVHPVGTDTTKDTLFSRLANSDRGPGYCHFPSAPARGYDTRYFQGLTAEKPDIKMRAGRRVRYWEQIRPRNEPLDCRVYATAALEILNPNFTEIAARLASTGTNTTTAAAPPRRRIISRGVQV